MRSDPLSERSSQQPPSCLKAPLAQQEASKACPEPNDDSSALRAMGALSVQGKERGLSTRRNRQGLLERLLRQGLLERPLRQGLWCIAFGCASWSVLRGL
jgi:hypothetical protein